MAAVRLASLRSSNRSCFSLSLVARGRTCRFGGREMTDEGDADVEEGIGGGGIGAEVCDGV